MDTIRGSLCIASRGQLFGEDYSCYSEQKIVLPKPRSFSYLRIVDPIDYGYIAEAGNLLQGIEFAGKEI